MHSVAVVNGVRWKTDLADVEIWELKRQGEGGSLIKSSEMEKYSLLLLAPENLPLIAQKDKDIWQMLKAQSFLEEFCTGEILSRISHSHFLLL